MPVGEFGKTLRALIAAEDVAGLGGGEASVFNDVGYQDVVWDVVVHFNLGLFFGVIFLRIVTCFVTCYLMLPQFTQTL